jgi:hypothetical protein
VLKENDVQRGSIVIADVVGDDVLDMGGRRSSHAFACGALLGSAYLGVSDVPLLLFQGGFAFGVGGAG